MDTINDVWVAIQPYKGLFGMAAVFFGPSLASRAFTAIRGGGHQKAKRPPLYPRLSNAAYLLLAANVAYAVYAFVYPPYDVFEANNLHLRAQTVGVRLKMLNDHGLPFVAVEESPYELMEHLLKRLSSVNGRYDYARWGHQTTMRCAWCVDTADFALAAIPSILGPYVAQFIFIGVLGWEWLAGPGAAPRADKLRTTVAGALGLIVGADYGARLYFDMSGGRQYIPLAHIIHQVRTVALAVLAIYYAALPIRSSPRDANVKETISNLTAALDNTRLASLVRGSVDRSPALSRLSAAGTQKRVKAEEAVLGDETLKTWGREVGMLDYKNRHIPLRVRNAQGWIRANWQRTVGRQREEYARQEAEHDGECDCGHEH